MRRLTRDPAELIPLKHSTYQVLLALGDGEAMHGYAIMQAVSAMTEGREAILPGTLYAALARMVDEGLVTESTPKGDASGGPARRYYQRTKFGPRGGARGIRTAAGAPQRRMRPEHVRRPEVTRWYQLALRAFPRRHRDLYGVEMIDAFDRELTARAGRARLSFGFAACLNAIGTGLVERQRQRRIRKGPAFSALDFTLAWRMLLRYPGLSLVSVLGMSVGITIAAGAFTGASMMMGTTLPLPEGDRLVSLLNWDASTSNRELRLLYDLEAWRDAKSVEDFSVSRNVQRNLIVGGRPPEVVMVAEISASAFRAARVGAYRGRTLLPEDERAARLTRS